MDKIKHRVSQDQMKIMVNQMRKFDLIAMIYRLYAHIMGEVEIEGVPYLDAVANLILAKERLAQKVQMAITKADLRSEPIQADLCFMDIHVQYECSCCKVCLDKFEHGCSACDGTDGQYL